MEEEGLKSDQRPVLLMAGSCNKIIGEDVQQIHKNIFGNAI